MRPCKQDAEPRADGGYRLNANTIGNIVDLLVDDSTGDGTLLLIPPLWSRLADFDPGKLSRLLLDRKVVRMS